MPERYAFAVGALVCMSVCIGLITLGGLLLITGFYAAVLKFVLSFWRDVFDRLR